MKNKYEIRGEITAIKVDNPNLLSGEILISTSDLPKLQELDVKWNVSHTGGRWVARAYQSKPVKKSWSLAKFLIGDVAPKVIIHKNGNELDFTRDNIEIASRPKRSKIYGKIRDNNLVINHRYGL